MSFRGPATTPPTPRSNQENVGWSGASFNLPVQVASNASDVANPHVIALVKSILTRMPLQTSSDYQIRRRSTGLHMIPRRKTHFPEGLYQNEVSKGYKKDLKKNEIKAGTSNLISSETEN
jgi:hypothetical protein